MKLKPSEGGEWEEPGQRGVWEPDGEYTVRVGGTLASTPGEVEPMERLEQRSDMARSDSCCRSVENRLYRVVVGAGKQVDGSHCRDPGMGGGPQARWRSQWTW